MDWIQFFNKDLKIGIGHDIRFAFKEPASESMLTALKNQFNLAQLPAELEALYRQTNGVNDCIYIETIDELIVSGEIIWPIERVIETNSYHRTSDKYKEIYKSFDNLFFFADAGNGDQFGFETVNGTFEHTDVFVWNHEDDSREWVAPSMKAFVEGWFAGTIKV
jgi:hypothetical protein